MAVGQVLVNWLLLGSLYAAVALGFSLVWGIMNIVNLAHGAFIIVGAYTAFWMYTQLHIDPYLGIPLTMAVLFVIGWIVQYVAINRVIRAPLLVTFLLTFGLNLLIADLVQQFFSSDLRSINTAYAGNGIDIGSTHIAFDRLIAAVIAVLLTAALNYFLTRTRTGNAILATGMDRDAARWRYVVRALPFRSFRWRYFHTARLCHRRAWWPGYSLGSACRGTRLWIG
jgi:branched-chain amino acid transport system permease protein